MLRSGVIMATRRKEIGRNTTDKIMAARLLDDFLDVSIIFTKSNASLLVFSRLQPS